MMTKNFKNFMKKIGEYTSYGVYFDFNQSKEYYGLVCVLDRHCNYVSFIISETDGTIWIEKNPDYNISRDYMEMYISTNYYRIEIAGRDTDITEVNFVRKIYDEIDDYEVRFK